MRHPGRSAFVFLVLLSTLASASQPPTRPPRRPEGPVFSPPRDAGKKKTADAPGGETQEAGRRTTSRPDEVAQLFSRLRKWPSRRARSAAVVLAGLGERVKPRLVRGLSDDDWRIRAGCAFALGEMQAMDAVGALVESIRDPSNRAGIGELFRALIRLDPQDGPATVLPFMSHSSARIRRAAMRALPAALETRYLPDVLGLFRQGRGLARAQALELLSRIPGAEERDEFFRALGDPSPRVAMLAARHLAGQDTSSARERLLELAREAPLRKATYAMLSLVMIEDRTGTAIIDEAGPIGLRARRLLTLEDPFYRGAAAVVVSNLSYRSADPILRKLADEYLVGLLLHAVAGGVFYSDYSSLEELCFRKLSLLTGQAFANDTRRWVAWWDEHKEGFSARHRLRALGDSDLAHLTVRLERTAPDGKVSSAVFRGPEAGERRAFVLSPEQLARLKELLVETRFFDGRDAAPPAGDGAWGGVQIEVRVREATCRRRGRGKGAGGLAPLADWLDELEKELAWQRFIVAEGEEEHREALRVQQEFFAREKDERKRRERVLELALSAYPRLDRSSRRLAVVVFSRADPIWIRKHSQRLAGLLAVERRLNDEAVALVELLSSDPDPELRERILDAVAQAGSARGREVLGRYVSLQPMPVVVRLMNDERAMVRAAAYLSAVRFRERGDIVDLLISGLKDYEPSVREACVQALASMKDERIVHLLQTVIEGEDEALRIRAIPALARVGGEQVVERLMRLYHEGGGRVKWAVVHALKEAGGRRAVVALAGIVRDTGPMEFRREALDMLVQLGGTDVAERLREILGRTRDGELKILLMGALARVLGPRAAPSIRPFLEDEDASVRRASAITLGRLGIREALEPLLDLLDTTLGDAAAEKALEALTFHVSEHEAPALRHQDFVRWAKAYGNLERKEWFILEARASGVPLDDRVDWLDPPALSRPQVKTFIALLKLGTRPLRRHADQVLLAQSGLPLEPLNPGASKAEAEERARIYEAWAARLKRGKTPR